MKYYSFIISPSLNNKFVVFLNILFTYWVIHAFKSVGKNPYIERPIYIKGGKSISIGDNMSSLSRLRVECWEEYCGVKYQPNLIIGNNVVFNYNCHIGCINNVSIGNNVLFGSNVLITDHIHGYADNRDLENIPIKRNLFSKGPVIIEDNVLIGENVSIMPNVNIGKNSIIGANSVITKDVPENAVVAGIPGRIIKYL